MNLSQIERVATVTKEDFLKQYFEPQKPVVIERFIEDWPALKLANGYITNLEHGNMLYIPEGNWHYMKYSTSGFSMSLRSIAHKPKNILKAVYNIFIMRNIDNLMRKLKGQQWIDWKNEQAIKK